MHVAAVGQGVGQRLEVAARGGHTTAQNSVTVVKRELVIGVAKPTGGDQP
jgi:hypothetical protein